ncbi:MAG: protein kinase [Polyangiaceae bacterium]|nr:protein kinase [Polyangiaceae bacterium]
MIPSSAAASSGKHDLFDWVGSVVDGRYRVDAVVGEGGFGLVYRGFHLGLGFPVAIKCLKIPAHFVAEAKELLVTRFREEGVMLSKLSEHPNIVRVIDFGTGSRHGEPIPYLVLEWLEGQSLADVVAARRASGRGPFSESEALRMLKPVADALAFAHRHGIAHRDIKPENVFVTRSVRGEVPKVLDFGIAKAMQEGETRTQLSTRTSSGFSAFSPAHGAPEQFHPKRFGPTGPWTDVHAFGLLLCEVTSLRPALHGEDTGDLFVASTTGERRTPRQGGAHVSDAFEALCVRATAIEPSKRFANAIELVDALSRCEAGLGAASDHATAPTAFAAGYAPAGASAQTAQPLTPVMARTPAKPARRRWWGLAIAGSVVVALGAGAVALAVVRGRPAKKKAKKAADIVATCLSIESKDVVDFDADAAALSACEKACSPQTAAACVVHGRALVQPKDASPADRSRAVEAFSTACDAGDAKGCARLGDTLTHYRGPRDDARAVVAYQKACDAGDQHACRRYGVMLSSGRGIKKDAPRAMQLFQKACDSGDKTACANLSLGYAIGRGAPKDEARAVALAKQACDGGAMAGCDYLGLFHEQAVGGPKDYARAAQYFEQACNGGGFEGCRDLGGALESGRGVASDPKRAFELYQKACDGGDMAGCNRLGRFFDQGKMTVADPNRAAALFRLTCDAGEAEGCNNLGYMLETGRGIERDVSAAVELYRKGCDDGNMRGCSNYGLKLMQGSGVAKDEAKGVELEKRACEDDDMVGCRHYASAFENGTGVAKNPERAVLLYRRACDGGDMDACTYVANLYLLGQGTLKNEAVAAMLYKRACDADTAMACATLGYLHEIGKGVPKDPVKAHALYKRACDGGNRASCDRMIK